MSGRVREALRGARVTRNFDDVAVAVDVDAAGPMAGKTQWIVGIDLARDADLTIPRPLNEDTKVRATQEGVVDYTATPRPVMRVPFYRRIKQRPRRGGRKR